MPIKLSELSKDKVFAELDATHGKQHRWKVDDLDYNPPPNHWLAQFVPARPRAGAQAEAEFTVKLELNPGAGVGVQNPAGSFEVYLVGQTARGEISTNVGRIANK